MHLPDASRLCLPARPDPPSAAAYTMSTYAAGLLVGLVRAKAKAEAREQFTLTPMLIGGWLGGWF